MREVSFSNADVPFALLRQRAFNLRWATLPGDVIPLTAADPDFAVAQPIRDAVAEYALGGVFSYGPAEGLPDFRATCARIVSERKGVPTAPERILAVDSAAAGMRQIAALCLQPGDEAIVFDPVDFLFKASVEAAGGVVRLLPVDPLTGMFDFSVLPSLVSPKTRLLCVCNPQNPIGRVLTSEELRILGEFAVAHGLWILNDEIWSDIVFTPRTFTSIASISPEIAARTFTVHGFSKSFGLAGLRVGFVIAPSDDAFQRLLTASLAPQTMTGVSTLSQIAAIAAYTSCWEWHASFLAHLTAMRDRAVHRLQAIPGVDVRSPEGVYVLFPRVSAFGMASTTVAERLLAEARVAVVPGAARWFGPGAEGHIRICFATSEAILDEGLDRIEGFLRDC